MLPDISKLTEKELLKLRTSVEKALSKIERSKKAEAKKAAEAAARKLGFSLSDLIDAGKDKPKKAKRVKAPAKPRYRNPANSEQTWSGRGRQPVWFKEAIAAGTDPAKMEI